jgi:hypothetical protein
MLERLSFVLEQVVPKFDGGLLFHPEYLESSGAKIFDGESLYSIMSVQKLNCENYRRRFSILLAHT